MSARMKWLKLSANAESSAATALPENLKFEIKKPFFTASVVLAYELVGDSIKAKTKLLAKIPIYGKISYSIDAESKPQADPFFAFESVTERDDGKGNYRKVSTQGKTLTLETSDAGAESVVQLQALDIEPPAPLLVHLLALPALQQSREDGVDIYVAQLVNGAKIQALRLDRLSSNDEIESYRGRTLSSPRPLSESEFRDLSWQKAKSFEFDFDLKKNTIAAARIHLPIVGRIEIK